MPKRGCEEDDYKGKEGEELPEILAKSMKYCWGDGFLDVFREYFRKHAHKFEVIKRKIRTHLDLLSILQSGGKNVKTFRWDHRLQIQNLFMAFKRVPRW